MRSTCKKIKKKIFIQYINISVNGVTVAFQISILVIRDRPPVDAFGILLFIDMIYEISIKFCKSVNFCKSIKFTYKILRLGQDSNLRV